MSKLDRYLDRYEGPLLALVVILCGLAGLVIGYVLGKSP